MCASRFPRIPRERSGRRRRRSRPKPSAAFLLSNEVGRENCRARFSAFGGRRPSPLRRGQFRAQPTAKPAWSAPRAGFAYSLAKGTLQGRCGNTSRRARESFSRPEKARVGCYQLPCVDGASGAVGCCGAAVSRHFANCLDRQTQAPRQFWGDLGGLGVAWQRG